MATALQLSVDGSDPTYTVEDGGTTPVVEPLGGFPTVDDLMDRFAEEVYDQSTDSHLYRFLQGLCGDMGAGQLKKQSYVSRLKNEAQGLVFQEIDTQYAMLRFPRLSFEFPLTFFDTAQQIDPASSVLTKDEWDAIELGDESYTHRIKLFLQACRIGNSPEGMAEAAQAGSGMICDIFETYKSIYANLHDEAYVPSGGYSIPNIGMTQGTSEFVILPHIDDNVYTGAITRSAGATYPAWQATHTYIVGEIVTPTAGYSGHYFAVTVAGTTASGEPTWPLDGTTVVNGTVTFQDVGAASFVDVPVISTADSVRMDAERERNMIHTLDNLRPVGTIMTVRTKEPHYVPIKTPSGVTIDPTVLGSTSNFHLVRFVTGSLQVTWPQPDEKVQFNINENNPLRTKGYFIEAGVEKEQKYLPLTTRSKPVINHTIENVVAYGDEALGDPDYGTSAFNPGKYVDYHVGQFSTMEKALYPALATISGSLPFRPFKAVAIQNTPLVFETNVKK